jgi:proline iminopeptidase
MAHMKNYGVLRHEFLPSEFRRSPGIYEASEFSFRRVLSTLPAILALLTVLFSASGSLAQAAKPTHDTATKPAHTAPKPAAKPPAEPVAAVYPAHEGFVDANGVMIYYFTLGRGKPLVIVHGGPGASHDYFLPYLLPLARHNQLVFIDERGSGRSQKLEDASRYTVENMVEDVEAVRRGLNLGKISLLGHSYGGALAQAYALKYQSHLSHLILASTWSSTDELNRVFAEMKEKMPSDVRKRINRMEAEGLFGHGHDYEKNRYTNDYMIAAWGEGYFPYLYQNRPDPNYDPVAAGNMSWDLYREMWGSHGEYVVDGNLKSVEYTNRLATIKVPTLILVGDHDECAPPLSEAMHAKIAGSRLVVLPKAGHMTFVDDTGMFLRTVDKFVTGRQ